MRNVMKYKLIYVSVLLYLTSAHAQNTNNSTDTINKKQPGVKVAFSSGWNPDKDAFKYVDSLPKNYSGVSAEQMVKWVLKQSPQSKKEYEKQDEYEQRVSLIEESLEGRLYAFHVKDVMSYKYDADKEVFKTEPRIVIYFMGSDNKNFDLARNERRLGSYIASNVYGKSIKVAKYEAYEYGIYLSKKDLLKTGLFIEDGSWLTQNSTLTVPIQKARAIKASDISMLLVGHIGVRNIEHTEVCLTPKIDVPFDGCTTGNYLPLELKRVFIYHKPSGDILAIKDIE